MFKEGQGPIEKKETGVNEQLLQEILTDRQKVISPDKDLRILTTEAPDQEHEQVINDNLRLLHLLNGHRGADLRKIIVESKQEAAIHLQQLYNWSLSAANQESVDLTGHITNDIPEILSGIDSPEQVYQRLMFLENNQGVVAENYEEELFIKTAQALGAKADGKWIDLIDKLKQDNDPEQAVQVLLVNLGFIPEEFLTKQKFKNLGAEYLTSMLDRLRVLEDGDLKDQAMHSRAQLINYLFSSKTANTIRPKNAQNITLDTNGIFINLKGFHSHLPYGLIKSDCLAVLAEDNWLSEQEIQEIKLRLADQNFELTTAHEIKQQQLLSFAEKMGIAGREPDSILEALFTEINNNPEKFAEQISTDNLVVPDSLINYLVDSQDTEKIFAAMQLAELVGADLTEETLEQQTGFSSRDIIDTTQETYDLRAKIINDPRYYNTLKITRAFLEAGIDSEPDNKFLAFRGQYKKSPRGNQHSFIEVMHDGKLARVLIDEDKHLGSRRAKNLQHLELFDRPQYENLENALQTFDHFVSIIKNLEKIKADADNDWHFEFVRAAESALHFVLTNITSHYQEANKLFGQISHPGETEAQAYYDLMHLLTEAQLEYEKFFYSNLSTVADFEEKFSPEVHKVDIKFGPDFAKQAADHVAKNGQDAELSKQAEGIRVCILDYKTADPTETIPFHIEESCLDALRLQRDRPLINVIGGCRKAEGVDNPLDKFSAAVMNVAHDHRANVWVPGTQSGIGVTFGWQNVDYKHRFGHLPHREQAHLFSVNPGGNTYLPGNKYIEGSDREEVFANTPVDSIITPFDAGWGADGKDKYQSPYRNHIAYMESLYQRMAYDQPKVMVVGNGGLFSIMEINESLQRGFDLVLVKGTGRFADAAAAMIENLENIHIPDNFSELSHQVIDQVKQSLPDDIAQEFLQKDFGGDEQTDDENHEVYRDFFWQFLKLVQTSKNNIHITDLDNLQEDLDNRLAQ